MPYREKSAWISLGTYLAIYGYYFARLAHAASLGQSATFPFAHLLGRVMWTLLAAEVVLHGVAGAVRPKETNAPRDEREKLIELKSSRFALPVVMIGAAVGAGAVAYGMPSFYTANGIFLAIVLAQIVKSASQAIQFRQGA